MSVDLEEAREDVREGAKGIIIYPFGFVVKWIYKLIKRMKMKKIVFIILFLLNLASNVLADNKQGSVTFEGTATGTGAFASFASADFKSLSVQLIGTWSGTVTLQGSNDCQNYVSVYGRDVVAGATSSSTMTANGLYYVPVNFKCFRLNATSYSSGTIQAYVYASYSASDSIPSSSGSVYASDETSSIYNGSTALTPKFAAISASTSGNNTLVAAVTSKKIRVLYVVLISNGTVNAKFQSGAGGTDLTGLIYLVANSGYSSAYVPVGNFETASNTLLNLNLSGAVAVGGYLVYVEV